MNTKVFLTTALLFAVSFTSAFAKAQKVANSAVNVNGTWYYCATNLGFTSGGAFNGADLGVLESLQLGGQSQAWDGNGHWNGGGQVQMSYKIDDGTEEVLYLDYWALQYYNDSGETWMKFQTGGGNFTPATIDISGLAEGRHTLAVWFHCDNAYDSNNGNNFVANFTKPYKVANSSDISPNSNPVAVQLDGLTLYKDDHWNTICLPFDLNVQTSVLAGAEIRELNSASVSGSTLTLNFSNSLSSASIEAGKPYIIKWSNGTNIVDPVFTNVVLSTNQAGEVPGTGVTFKGTFDEIVYNSEPDNILFVGESDVLYYPAIGASIHPFHAYFDLGTNASPVKAVVLNFGDEENGILLMEDGRSKMEDAYFTLDGLRLLSQPISPGIYIHNGRKVLIK